MGVRATYNPYLHFTLEPIHKSKNSHLVIHVFFYVKQIIDSAAWIS